jgi:hypothetical protein
VVEKGWREELSLLNERKISLILSSIKFQFYLLFNIKKYLLLMKDLRRRQLAAAKSGKEVLDLNNGVWDLVTKRADKHLALKNHIATIEDLDLIVTKDIKGFAIDKRAKKIFAGEKALKVAKALTVFAKETNDAVLEQEINFERSDLIYSSDEDAPGRWQLVFDRGNSHNGALTSDYGLVMADITNIGVARLSFLAADPKSDAAKAARTAAVGMMENEFAEMGKTIVTIKELAAVLNDTEKELVKTLLTALKIDDIGKRKVNAILIYRDFDTNVLLRSVIAEIVETGVRRKSTRRGLVQLKSLNGGNYKIQSQLKGYEENILDNVGIEEGVLKRIEIRLKKKT